MTVFAALAAVMLSTDGGSAGTYRIRTASCPECDKDAIFKQAKAPKSFDCGSGTERDFLKANKVAKCVLKMAKGKKPFHALFARAGANGIEEVLLLRDGKKTLRVLRATRGPCGTRVESSACKSFKSSDTVHPACVRPSAVKALCAGAESETFSEARPLSELRCEWAGGDKGRQCKVGTAGVEPIPGQDVVCTPQLRCDVSVRKP